MASPEEAGNEHTVTSFSQAQASQQINDLFDSPEFAKAVETEEFSFSSTTCL